MTRKRKIIIVKSLFNFIILGSIVFLSASFGPFLKYELEFRIFELTGKKYVVDEINGQQNVSLEQAIFSSNENIYIKPQDPNFDIIIPKIGLNERIIDNVNPNDENAIEQSLKVGVGKARGTAYPNQFGNTYLFAHSSTSVLSINRYNAVFTLLRDLSQGDKIYIFYLRKEYVYSIYDKVIVPPNDTKEITFNSPFPKITLQTCDPPGLNINRLLIMGKMVKG